MDPSVIAAMAKWPNIPDCHGWLSLDRRGRWRLQGKPVSHTGLAEFIGRNYVRDVSGAWYMQNGPQRVWVALELTPWVFRLGNGESLLTHTGQPVSEMRAVWLVDGELLCLDTEHGLGAIDDRDLPAFLERLRTIDGSLPDGDLSSQLLELDWGGQRLPVRCCRNEDLVQIGNFRPQADATDATNSPA
jgi:hypothetical protein